MRGFEPPTFGHESPPITTRPGPNSPYLLCLGIEASAELHVYCLMKTLIKAT